MLPLPLVELPLFKIRESTKYIVIHCSATAPTMDLSASYIDKWHRKDNGWTAIGYHLVIRRTGRVEGGRPLNVIGAHALKINATSVGVCLIGGLGQPSTWEDHFTVDQMQALTRTVEELLSMYPEAQVISHSSVDHQGKTCPNFDAEAWALATFPQLATRIVTQCSKHNV